MKTLILEAARDSETGTMGLVLAGQRNDGSTNTAAEGLLIAHDLIEHQNGSDAIGSIDDELEALGAIWYVRGQHGELQRAMANEPQRPASFYTIEQNIAADITRMFRDCTEGGAHLDWSGVRALHAVLDDDHLQAILDAADDSWRGEFQGPDYAAQHKQQWLEYRDIALYRMRRGYTKARRRWEARYGRFGANNVFWAIAEAVHPHAKHCEYEGQQFILRYSCKAATATCEEHYPED